MSTATLSLREFAAGARDVHVWSLLARDDIRGRYRRTMLGPLWLTLSHAIFVVGLGFSFSIILRQPLNEYFVYLAAGMTVWVLISTSLIEGPAIFIRGHNLLYSYDLPASVHIFRAVLSQFMMFAHHLLIYLAALVFVNNVTNANTLYVIPGLLILATAMTGWSTVLALIGARFRDVAPGIAALTQMAFMLTPIFWERTHLQGAEWFALINPLYHFVEVVRAPMLGRAPEPMTWVITIGLAIALCALGIAAYAWKRRNLSYWL